MAIKNLPIRAKNAVNYIPAQDLQAVRSKYLNTSAKLEVKKTCWAYFY